MIFLWKVLFFKNSFVQDYAQWQRVTTETETSETSHPSAKITLKPKSLSSAVSSSKYSSG